MIRSLIISPDTALIADLQHTLPQTGSASVARTIDKYPSVMELTRVIRAHAPQLVFVSTDSMNQTMAVAQHLEQISPGVQVIAAGRSTDPDTLMTLMRAGIREFLHSPINPALLLESIARVADLLKRRPVHVPATDLVYSFLPAKPGVGATTLAVNSSLSIAQRKAESTLLCDFDLNSGIVRFLLKLSNAYSVLDAATRGRELDENIWAQLVAKAGDLDVLHAGALNPEIRLQDLHLQDFLDYTRRNYKVVSLDLSGNLEKYATELMHESRRVFLVTTTEACSLYLAREKMDYLRRLDLGDRVSILVNRYQRRQSISCQEIEDLLGAPVLMTFPNDYTRLTRAIADAKPIEPGCELGKQTAALAEYMRNKPVASPEPRRRFVEYFTIAPARFALESKKFDH